MSSNLPKNNNDFNPALASKKRSNPKKRALYAIYFDPLTLLFQFDLFSKYEMKFSRKYRAGLILSRFTVRNGKKSPNQETGLGNMGHLKVLNDTKLV